MMGRRARRGVVGTAIATVVWGMLGVSAQAKPEFQEVFAATYPAKAGTSLEKAACAVCHAVAGPPKRNPYGDAIHEALRAASTKTLTEPILRQVEADDSDGDNWSNRDELAAGALPGNPDDTPSAAAAQTPTSPDNTTPKPAGTQPTAPTTAKTPAPAAVIKTPVKPKPTRVPPAVKPASPSTVKPPPPKTSAPIPSPVPTTPPTNPTPTPTAVAVAPPTSPTETSTPPAAVPAPAPRAKPAPTPPKPLFDQLVPKHSFHPIIVHFPIALFLFGGLCEVFGTWKRRMFLRAAGALNMSAASAASLVAVLTGFMAGWRGGYPLEGMVLVHMFLAVSATATMGATALVGWSFTNPHKERASVIYWALLGISLLLIGIAGHFGGELVYGG